MKKTFFICALLLTTLVSFANPVGKERATRVAQNAVMRFCAERHSIDSKQPVILTDVSQALGFNLLHIYTYRYSGVEGFIVISGDDMTAPVLAFSDEGELDMSGTFDGKHPIMNPAFIQQLQHYSNEIWNAREIKATTPAYIARKWQMLESDYTPAKGDIYNDNIPALLGHMIWGQGKPYNAMCPGGSITGCVATAFGMMMNYWKYPEHGFGQHSYNGANNPAAYPDWTYGTLSADFEHTYYDWNNMPDYVLINSTDAEKNAVATLLYHIGVALEMRYSPDASGSWSLPEYAIFDTSLHLNISVSAPYCLPKHFGYKYSYAGMRDSIHNDSLWLQMLYNSLVDGKPIYYAGWAKDTNEAGHSGTSGHGYVIDGYFSDEIDSNYFHINWGWSGNSNAFFKLDAMTPSDFDFTQWHGAVIGFEPDTSYHGYDYTGIHTPAIDDATIYGGKGHVTVLNAQGRRIAVYDVMGREVLGCISHDSEWRMSLRPGFYAVKVDATPAKKVLVF